MFSGSILPPEEALRSEPGILSGEARAVLKAVAFRLILGADSFNHELLSLTLLRSAIAGLETNEGSRLALTSFLRELQVRGIQVKLLCVTRPFSGILFRA